MNKRTWTYLVMLAALLGAFPMQVSAQSAQERAGSAGATYLLLPKSARSASMGGSITGGAVGLNGLEALDLAREHRPDLILMDIQLPEVSGLEVTKWLKEDDELANIPVIAVTAFAMKGDEERIRQGGCEAYISKPISVGKFLETVKSYLGDG